MDWPPRRNERLEVVYAFVATVTEASNSVDPAQPDLAEFDWHVELRVDRLYRGRLPERLSYNGWSVGCHELRGDRLRTGDRLFVVTNVFMEQPRPRGVDPFAAIGGQVVAWKWIDGRWRFHEDALDQGSDHAFYPAAARRATTTEEILRLIQRAEIPATSTAPRNGVSTRSWHAPVLAVTFLLGIALIAGRLNKRARPAT